MNRTPNSHDHDDQDNHDDIDRQLAKRIREASDAWQQTIPSEPIRFDQPIRFAKRTRRRRLWTLSTTAALALIAVCMFPHGDGDVRPLPGAHELTSDVAPTTKTLRESEERLADLIRQERAISDSLHQMELRIREQQRLLERLEREQQQIRVLATLRAIETHSEGLLPEATRNRLQSITKTFRLSNEFDATLDETRPPADHASPDPTKL